MNTPAERIAQERQMLLDAQQRGPLATLGTFVRLSGPGWLQSAITLGGGSLAGALFLGILGGTTLIWLQLVAIVMGVIMLSAISYVTLTTGQRPFRAINQHINPVLGWGWLIATCMANMIWCMPQFALCYAALQSNLVGPETLTESYQPKLVTSLIILSAAGGAVLLNNRRGAAAKAFDWFLKALVGMIVICFVGVVGLLTAKGQLNWGEIVMGFVPDFTSWNRPAGNLEQLLAGTSPPIREFWNGILLSEQRAVMIGAAATAVGINMTFLMPYTLLNRGWDKPFRGLARFDLSTGMAIPYVLVTSCVVIAAASTFHAKVDEQFQSDDPAVMVQSEVFGKARPMIAQRMEVELGKDAWNELTEEQQLTQMAQLSLEEKQVAASLVRRDAFQLSKALAPLLGEDQANLVFGLGIFGMGFSTIIILMLINGFAFCEMLDKPLGGAPYVIGCLVAGVSGAMWPYVWDGDAKLWLAILASSFGMMLLPIAYVTFFMMMNNKQLMGEGKPTGVRMLVWNVLMAFSVIGAVAATIVTIREKANDPKAGTVVIVVAAIYVVLVIVGFMTKKPAPRSASA
jgi:Mn2+/Fe2+ NRAMP family transporter